MLFAALRLIASSNLVGWTDKKRGMLPVSDFAEDSSNLLVRTRLQDVNFSAKRLGRSFGIRNHYIRIWIRWIYQHGDCSASWRQFCQQLKSLGGELRSVHAHAGRISSRPVQTGNNAKMYRVHGNRKHDRNRLSRCRCRQNSVRTSDGDDHLNAVPNETCNQFRKAIILSISEAVLECRRFIGTLKVVRARYFLSRIDQ